jgi:hypothetical protein
MLIATNTIYTQAAPAALLLSPTHLPVPAPPQRVHQLPVRHLDRLPSHLLHPGVHAEHLDATAAAYGDARQGGAVAHVGQQVEVLGAVDLSAHLATVCRWFGGFDVIAG